MWSSRHPGFLRDGMGRGGGLFVSSLGSWSALALDMLCRPAASGHLPVFLGANEARKHLHFSVSLGFCPSPTWMVTAELPEVGMGSEKPNLEAISALPPETPKPSLSS